MIIKAIPLTASGTLAEHKSNLRLSLISNYLYDLVVLNSKDLSLNSLLFLSKK
jgi:hypothetical protein